MSVAIECKLLDGYMWPIMTRDCLILQHALLPAFSLNPISYTCYTLSAHTLLYYHSLFLAWYSAVSFKTWSSYRLFRPSLTVPSPLLPLQVRCPSYLPPTPKVIMMWTNKMRIKPLPSSSGSRLHIIHQCKNTVNTPVQGCKNKCVW